ncbi:MULTISPECIES: amino acid ABC transporter permease [Microbacterium]|jgi:polar amino acid transport system permease protein|uniref:amino acid ABC transporter permease n=1 Tax=Microbacterium TaxID=33882 RepID=UPI0023DC25DE|nr:MULTISPECIES: amino acid ABC transporter permease [Microbacterium]MDF2045017.1 amino acid ABC transporter permease [Microbacterium sp. Kw_RZR3]MDF2917111.1 amino acid transporter permease [Microbacterium sp.]MDQ1075560.1 polar amino acid transport system permease protein [Microbacterium sp. SORGH_AS_0969]MDQ1115799.1 polar amino acid transport system permease protein [Microbacterium testaceum]
MDLADTLGNIARSFFDVTSMLRALPDMLAYGIWNTLLLSLAATVIGIVLGLGLAVMGTSRSRLLRTLSRIYTDIFRGLPAILTILLIGTGLAPLFNGITRGNPYPLGILALSLIASAYLGEIFRAGILAVDKGQLEAARALGMTHRDAMRLIVIPQAVRQVLPSLVNQFIAIVKDSSLVYFLGLITSQRELFRIGQDAAITNGNLSPLVLAGIFYLIITVPLTHLVNVIDRRLRDGRPLGRRRRPANDAPAETVLPDPILSAGPTTAPQNGAQR